MMLIIILEKWYCVFNVIYLYVVFVLILCNVFVFDRVISVNVYVDDLNILKIMYCVLKVKWFVLIKWK